MFQLARTLVLITGTLFFIGGSADAAEKRQAHAHAHGAADLNIVVEGKKVTVEFRSPAEDIMGFEHEAKSDADKKKRDAAMNTIKERFGEMVVFDKKLGCKYQPGEVSLVRTDDDPQDPNHGKGDHKKGAEHREVRATHHFICAQEPAGSRVRFAVSKMFPSIRDLKIQVLSGAKQSGAKIQRDKGDVAL